MPKIVTPALSFRAALDQKLVTIIRAFGTATEGAKRTGVCLRTFNRWRSGTFPEAKLLPFIDDTYLQAVALLNDPELMKKRAKTAKKITSLSKKLKLSEDTIRLLQAEGLY